MGVGLVNTGMVGHLSATAISAVGLTNRATMVAWALFQAVSTGTTVLVAQSVGSGRRDRARAVASQALLFGTSSVMALALVFAILGSKVLSIFRPEASLLATATGYLRIVVLGMPAVGIMTASGATMRGAGNTRTPMLIAVFVNLVNLAGNSVLIYGKLGFPAMGITGSAISTVTAQWIGAALALMATMGRNSPLGVAWRGPWRFSRRELGQMLEIGLPATGESLFWQAAALILTLFITGFGTEALAAHQLGVQAESLSYMPTAGFGIAATALVGQAIGAGNPRLARRVTRELGMLVALITAFTTGLLLFLPKQILGLLTNDSHVVALGAIYLRLMGTAQIPQQLSGVFTGALRGSGDTRTPMYIAAIGLWGVRLPLAYILAFPLNMGIAGIWTGMTLDLFVRFTLTAIRYRRIPWARGETLEIRNVAPGVD
ncbi:MAG TPA: MATE family efflux transporter [Firmicutes bacterium]|jgi:putative MATE family efflux protein|nr:MATE family efflux transporter [Candidatus Fermentithermobacillaceae bacterium]